VEIAHYRDYWSPLAAAEALGGLDELTDSFATGGGGRVTITVLVIADTGTTGSRVAALLRDQGVAVRIATRRPSAGDHVRFDRADPATYGPAGSTGSIWSHRSAWPIRRRWSSRSSAARCRPEYGGSCC
jgi:hypothetical protein